MWFTREERIGIFVIGLSMLLGAYLLNERDKKALGNLNSCFINGVDNSSNLSENGKLINIDEKLDINTASFEELVQIPGIGPKIASNIIERRKIKKFKSLEELTEIRGIGEKKLSGLKKYLKVENHEVR